MICLLFSPFLFAQNGVKNEKELAQNFLQILQTQNLKNLETIVTPAELYPLFVEIFKEKAKEEIQHILDKDKNALPNLKIESEKISIQKVGKPEKLHLIAPNYYQIPLQISLQNITDVIFGEAYKHKKRWYPTDFTSAQIFRYKTYSK